MAAARDIRTAAGSFEASTQSLEIILNAATRDLFSCLTKPNTSVYPANIAFAYGMQEA